MLQAPITTRFDVSEHSQQPGAGWDPRFFDSQHMPSQAIADEHHHQHHNHHQSGYWKAPEPPMTPSFSPTYSSGPPSSMFQNSSFSSYSSAPTRPEHGWQPHPMRSMSFAGHGDEHPHRHDPYQPPYHSDMRRSTVDMLPPSSYSSATSSATSMVESPITPAPGPLGAQHSHMHYSAPPGWSTLPSQSPKTVEFGGGWYQEPSQLPKVQEEDVNQYSSHPPPSLYANSGSH
jgi:hypothetical protein